MHAYCFASGEILFGRKVPDGAILIATGPAEKLRRAIEPAARLAYDNRTLLVPGIPEADDQGQAGDALAKWVDWRRKGWTNLGLTVNPAVTIAATDGSLSGHEAPAEEPSIQEPPRVGKGR